MQENEASTLNKQRTGANAAANQGLKAGMPLRNSDLACAVHTFDLHRSTQWLLGKLSPDYDYHDER